MRLGRNPQFLLLIAALFLTGTAWAEKPQSVRLTLLYTNDTHGRLRPFSYPETYDADSPLARLQSRSNIGGIARRATLAARVRAEAGRHVLLLDTGDICDGTPFSTEYRGDADIAAMNASGYDLACPGNHEFNNPLTQVKKMAADARFPILCANVREKATDRPLYQPYVVKQIGEARVAFFGLLTTDTRNYPAAREGCTIDSPIPTARRLVPELRRKADFVVALTHLGVEEDRRLAVEVDGIDVIVGGHSHTHLPTPLFVGAPPRGNPHSVNGTIIVQNFQWGGTLGRLDLALFRDERRRWSVRSYSGKLMPITSRIPEDPRVAEVVARYWQPLAAKYGEVLANAEADFTALGHDEAHYNLVADAMRSVAGTDFDLQNFGGVRAPIAKGPITYEHVVTIDPFENTIVTFSVTGRELRQLLMRLRPAVSGIRYAVEGGELVVAEIGGKPIEDDRIYRGSTNSYFAGNPAFSEVRDRVDTGRVRRNELAAYLRRVRSVRPQYDGRRIVRESLTAGSPAYLRVPILADLRRAKAAKPMLPCAGTLADSVAGNGIGAVGLLWRAGAGNLRGRERWLPHPTEIACAVPVRMTARWLDACSVRPLEARMRVLAERCHPLSKSGIRMQFGLQGDETPVPGVLPGHALVRAAEQGANAA